MYDDYSMQSTEYEDESSDKTSYMYDPYYDNQEFVPKKSEDNIVIQKGKIELNDN